MAIKNYEWKMEYLLKRQDYHCAICGMVFYMSKIDLCHRAHRTKWRERKFPLFINSVFNMRAGHNTCNTTKLGALNISDLQAEQWERFLARHPNLARWGNGTV
jgi:hypothetical protein